MEISHFEVQRSTDGTNFTTIGTVSASANETNYTFTDLQPAAVNYYRLLTTTADGSTVYSPIRTIDLSATAAISVYPIPASATMNVSLVNAGSGITVRLMSISGQILQSSVTTGGTQVVSMDVSRYPAGMYIVQVIGQNSVLQTIPMTKL
jgi:D-arabinose 1-dehydrogenase-like Zn-dependent alcohol dehydrogenase